jgi:hypothetical protein
MMACCARFFNVCRHHAAAVMTEPEGKAAQLRCPYHGWTYSLEGELKGTPDFSGVCNFDRASNGLVSLELPSGKTGYSSNWRNVAESLGDFSAKILSRKLTRSVNQSALVRAPSLQFRLQLESVCR